MAGEADLPVFIYTTFETGEDAEHVGGAMVEARLAACANIFPGMVSIYEWEGRIERSEEVAVILKTRRSVAKEAMAALEEWHPYDRPAIILLPTEGGSEDYCAWISEMTRGKARTS